MVEGKHAVDVFSERNIRFQISPKNHIGLRSRKIDSRCTKGSQYVQQFFLTTEVHY